MVLRLDPDLPLVWRDPFSLQFGVDPARVVLREVSAGDERVIGALRSGVTPAGLQMVARAAGVSPRDLESMLELLTPLLVEPREPAPPRRVAILGTGPTERLLAHALGETSIVITTDEAECDFGVAFGHYVLDPRAYGVWLRRDLPHLPIIFGDGAVTVGPLVEPGTTACLYCLEHHRRDADSSWSAIASQLWGRKSAAETPLAAREVAAIATRVILRRLEAGADPTISSATSIRLDIATGAQTRREWMPHPECGCIDLTSEALSRIGSAADLDQPTRSAVAPEPE
ncbi:MAG TPA: TOMM precursor leader peptide-binding protein [Galbitalea sp.]|jgi:bacteriocin biosynthesis cyclodehydratase domain-containing protein